VFFILILLSVILCIKTEWKHCKNRRPIWHP